MTANQHNDTEQFIKNLSSKKDRASSKHREFINGERHQLHNTERQLHNGERVYPLEKNHSTSVLERPQAHIHNYSGDYERKSETLNRPIRDLQTYLASPQNNTENRRTLLRSSRSPPTRATEKRETSHEREPAILKETQPSPRSENIFFKLNL